MFWKNGIEYRGDVPAAGANTRCDVARARPWVINSSPMCVPHAMASTHPLHTRNTYGMEKHTSQGKEVRTFADINDERVWARGHVDPFPGKILDLQSGVIRRL